MYRTHLEKGHLMTEHPPTTIDFEPAELVAIIDGLRAEIAKRAFWMISPTHPVRSWDLEDELAILTPMIQAYSKVMMVARDVPGISDQFKQGFWFSPQVWNLLDTIESATTWKKVPVHRHKSCDVCRELMEIG